MTDKQTIAILREALEKINDGNPTLSRFTLCGPSYKLATIEDLMLIAKQALSRLANLTIDKREQESIGKPREFWIEEMPEGENIISCKPIYKAQNENCEIIHVREVIGEDNE